MAGRIRQWIGFLIMAAGLCLLCGPFLQGAEESRKQEQVVEIFRQEEERRKGETAPSDIDENAAEKEQEESSKDTEEQEAGQKGTALSDAFFQDALAYNRLLAENGQDGMNTRSDVEAFPLSALDYGYPENIIGTIEIPRLEVELGLYLGANADQMARGAAIFGMTSLPLGMEDENTAIAGHRGWSGTPMFRDIQLIQMHDPIYITTPWRTLVYRVCGIQIVTPDDSRWCKIQKGRTLITLMTCHPYGQNYQRYIVYAELTDEEKPSGEEIERENRETFDPSGREITQVYADGTEETVIVEPVSIEPDGSEYGSIWSNFMIFAEDKMKIAAVIAAVLVLLTGIRLTMLTVRDLQKRKGDRNHESE